VANFTFNIAKGRVVELYNRVKGNDPANSALILVPLETSGLVADATLIDYDDLSTLLAGATNEQTTMGRKILTDADLATLPSPDDANDRYDLSLPAVAWSGANALGNAVSKILVCYDADTTSGTDSNIIPLTAFDVTITPDGNTINLASGAFFRAAG
jgi:hypothetical protein